MALAVTSLSGSGASGSASSLSYSPGVSIPAGATTVIGVGTMSGAGQLPNGASDGGGSNTYIQALAPAGSNTNGRVAIYYCDNCAAVASPSISGTYAAATTWRAVSAFYITGTATSSSLDVSPATSQATTATPSVATGTLAQADEVVAGILAIQAGAKTVTEASGWTNNFNTTIGSAVTFNFGYIIVSSTASINYNPTWSGSIANIVGCCSFKMAAATNNGNFFPFF